MADTSRMANAIRALAMDAVQKANSGHPGAPMGMAEMAVALWGRHLRHNPAHPHWPGRDRFVLSNGHASMLLYALLHLTGYDLPMQELEHFRQLHSKTAGHPEWGHTPGVETTTGPLGQGLGNAVGMALAEKLLAAEFNRPGHTVIDHHTWVFLGDGCLMEGISHEVCALAGAWKLNKLIALYDDNGISIDGHITPWFVDDVAERFKAYRWNVIGPIDGHDVDAVDAAIAAAKNCPDKPSIIICQTHIGKGSPNKHDTASAHGSPLGNDEIALTREAIGWSNKPFDIPPAVYADWDAKAQGRQQEEAWQKNLDAYTLEYPDLAAELKRRLAGELPAHFDQTALDAAVDAHQQAQTVASRKASQIALEALTAQIPELLGGSADLTGSNLTQTTSTPTLLLDAAGQPEKDEQGRPGRHIHYGVREFGMAAIMNGIALHGGYIPYGGTFLTFSDYSRNAIRMAALMGIRVIHVFTHDSIGVGEDGPTHQPIEHAASLRLIPNLDVWRPADTAETTIAWACALRTTDRPSALLLSRQNLPYLPKHDLSNISRGGYVLAEPEDAGLDKEAQIILLATGSEVHLALQAQALLAQKKIAARVVSMPSTSIFDRQSTRYKNSVLTPDVLRVAIEMGVSDGWWKYGCTEVVGINRFGASAPGEQLIEHFGFSAGHVVEVARAALRKK